MHKRMLLIASVVALASVTALVLSFTYPKTTDAAGTLSDEALLRAEQSASQCAGRMVDFAESEPLPGAADDIYTFKDRHSGDEFSIQTETGQVCFWMPARVNIATPTPATQTDAMNIAEQLRGRMTPDLNEGLEQQIERQTDDVRDEYIVTLSQHIKDVRTQNQLRVVIDIASGSILSATAHNTEIKVPLSATLSKSEAIAIAEKAGSIPIHTEKFAELRIIEGRLRKQVLVWWVELATGDMEYGGVRTVLVDAQSGEAVDVLWGGEHLMRGEQY